MPVLSLPIHRLMLHRLSDHTTLPCSCHLRATPAAHPLDSAGHPRSLNGPMTYAALPVCGGTNEGRVAAALALPCPADPMPGREDQSAKRHPPPDRPKPAGTRWVHTRLAARGAQRAPAVTTGCQKPQVNDRIAP